MSDHVHLGKVGREPDHESPPPAPRWVKAFGIGAIALVVLLVVMLASGHGGPHSPLRHLRHGDPEAHPSSAVGAPRPR